MAVYDNATGVSKLDFEHACALGFAVTIGPALIERLRNPLQRCVGHVVELARSHQRDKLISVYCLDITMRRVAGLVFVLLVLSACGNRGSLYLPPPGQNPQQDSKPAPRK